MCFNEYGYMYIYNRLKWLSHEFLGTILDVEFGIEK